MNLLWRLKAKRKEIVKRFVLGAKPKKRKNGEVKGIACGKKRKNENEKKSQTTRVLVANKQVKCH